MPGRGCQEACIISHMMSVPSLYSKHTLIHSPTHINRQVHTYEGLSHSHQLTTHTHTHTHTHTRTLSLSPSTEAKQKVEKKEFLTHNLSPYSLPRLPWQKE